MSRSPEITALLTASPLFRALLPDQIAELARECRDVRIDKGTLLFNRGDDSCGFYIVAYGQIKLAIPGPSGAEKVVEIIGPGQSFGEAVMFLDKPYLVYAQALADSLLIYVGKPGLLRLLERDAAFAKRMLAGLSMRLHGLLHDVAAYAMQTGTQRLIGYLLPQIHGDPPTVQLLASKHVVASRLNLTPETFSRILHELAAAKLIAVKAREIRILDLAALQAYGVTS